jgi:hypothetical protein
MRQYFCFSPRGVEAGGGAARVILREIEVTVGGPLTNIIKNRGYIDHQ